MLVAIETATDLGSVALGSGDELVGEVVIGLRSRHAESLLPALHFLLQSNRLERSHISAVVVGAGPGSFTGVRVAGATARGLAVGLGVPLFAYSSLAAVAVGAGSGAICALFDARRGEVYGACYQVGADGSTTTLVAPMAAPVEQVLEEVRPHAPRFVGDGAVRYADRLGIAAPAPLYPHASALLRIAAADQLGRGRVTELSGWEPEYLRGSGAERGVPG
jgi:tRNA threonylcarbamoyladenosine biosynthesis protein TsaB